MSFKLDIRMQQRVSPMLVLTNKLLPLAAVDFEDAIKDELAQNPALELAYKSDLYPARSALSEYSMPYHSGSKSLQTTGDRDQESDFLIDQVPDRPTHMDQLIAEARLLVDKCDHPLIEYVVHNLDRYGYLRFSPEELAAELDTPVETVRRVVHILQELDPPGIVARDLRECLQIQCRHLRSGDEARLALRILTESWDDFAHQHWGRIAQKLGVTCDEIDQARLLIRHHLYPYPLLLINNTATFENTFFYADLIITRDESAGGKFGLNIPAVDVIDLRINPDFEALSLRNCDHSLSEAEKMWITKRVDRARMFIKAVQQRWTTLQRIGEYLIKQQTAFLEGGPLLLQPLTRAKVAEALDLHESTVSRATCYKVAQLPDGRLMPLSDFFDYSIVAKERIRQLLNHTKEPLNDREIADILSGQGLPLARRTITKYRGQLKIPAVYGRRLSAG
jgi:RNA polymerase sigma-54 factor